jgi:hypothetical protein
MVVSRWETLSHFLYSFKASKSKGGPKYGVNTFLIGRF